MARGQQLHRDSTQDMVERAFRLHINPVLGDRALADLRRSNVQSWVKGLADELSASTVHLIYGYLASTLRAAAADRLIGRTPCEGIRLPPIERGERFIPTAVQVYAIAKQLPERIGLLRTSPPVAGCGRPRSSG